MKTEHRSFAIADIEIRQQSEDNEGRARGYAAVFNSDSVELDHPRYGSFFERIAQGAFARSLEEAARGDLNIFALWAHRDDSPLGSTKSQKLTLREDEHGLYFEMDTTRMTDAQLSALADGDLRMSFGFYVREEKWNKDEAGKTERTLLDIALFEVSFVISPAYPDTEAAFRSYDAWQKEISEETIEESNDPQRLDLLKRFLLRRLR